MLYTVNIAIVEITYYSGGNIDVTSKQAATLPQSDIDTLRFGSKLEFVSWYTYPGTICQFTYERPGRIVLTAAQGPSSSWSCSSTAASHWVF